MLSKGMLHKNEQAYRFPLIDCFYLQSNAAPKTKTPKRPKKPKKPKATEQDDKKSEEDFNLEEEPKDLIIAVVSIGSTYLSTLQEICTQRTVARTLIPGSSRLWQAVHPASSSPENARPLAGMQYAVRGVVTQE